MKRYFDALAYSESGRELVRLTTWSDESENIAAVKTVEYSDFCAALEKGRCKNAVIHTGLLPRNVLSVSIMEDGQEVIVFLPPEVRFLGYRKRGEGLRGFMIPYPGIVLKLLLKNEYAVPRSVWCTDSSVEWPDRSTKLYRFPFGNVSDAGSICMGGNQLKLSGAESTTEIVNRCLEMFFATPYNGDYYSVGNKIATGASLVDALTSLHGKGNFPDEWLVDSHCIVGSLLN